MSKAKSNYKTKLSLGDGATPEAFVEVPGSRLIPPIEEEEEDIEATHHGSGAYREFISSGLKDAGEMAFEMYRFKGDVVQKEVRDLKKSREVRSWKTTYPDGYGHTFSAYVKKIVENDADAQSPEGIVETVTLRLTGEVEDFEPEDEGA